MYYSLPSNEHSMRQHSLILEPKAGTNGQIRLIESKDCETCNGFMFVQERTAAVDPDYFYGSIVTRSTATDSAATTATTSGPSINLAANVLYGKQRNAFGSFIVVNKDLYSFEIWGYTATDADNVAWSKLFTTTAESSVQFLGGHELYWWPHTEFLLASLSDGSSFKFFRFNSNFHATVASPPGAISQQIENTGHRLWHVPNRVMVPPVFYQRMAYFYTADSDNKPHLHAYEYNPVIAAPELKCTESRNNVDNPG